MERTFLVVGSLSAALAVGLGAFGAHGLRDRLTPEMLAVFETGVRYHLVHALALVVVALVAARWPQAPAVGLAGWAFVAGTVLFSGSLYLVAVTGTRWLGAITPLGGAAFLVGWLALAWSAWRLAP